MTFREQLKKVEELGMSVLDLTVANECDCTFDFEYTEKEFESLCNKVRDCYLETADTSEFALALAINDFILEEQYTVEKILEMSNWEIIDKASYYI